MLNQTYQQVFSAVGTQRQALLRAAERAWVSYRDAECDFRMSAETGGADAPLVCNARRLELANDRLKALKNAGRVASF